jgi:uncharacterized protein (TIGR02145 family)
MKQKTKNFYCAFLIFGVTFLLTNSCDKSADKSETTSETTVTDIDGNVYHTVTIGKQVWMIENLKTTKYRNGDPIPNVSENTAWKNLTSGACCDFENKSSNSVTYGKLYNWHAVNDSRKLAPAGWHVPTDDEHYVLSTYLVNNGYSIGTNIGKSLAAISGWNADPTFGNVGNDQATNNKSGFTALPGGNRFEGGTFGFNALGNYGAWWNSTENVTYGAYYWSLSYNFASMSGGVYNKNSGFSVRCLRD